MYKMSIGGNWGVGSGAGELSLDGRISVSELGARKGGWGVRKNRTKLTHKEKEEMLTFFFATHGIAASALLGAFVHPIFWIMPILALLLLKTNKKRRD